MAQPVGSRLLGLSVHPVTGLEKVIAAAAVIIVGSLIGLATLGFILQAAGWEPDEGPRPSPTTTRLPTEDPSYTVVW